MAVHINFENSRLAYVDAYSYLLNCPEESCLESMNKIVDMVYRSYGAYNRQLSGVSLKTNYTPPFRRFLSEEGFLWDPQLSMYTNYGKFIGVFQRFVGVVVRVAELNESQEKELLCSYFNNIDDLVCRFVRGKICNEGARKIIDGFDRASLLKELPYEGVVNYVEDMFLTQDEHLATSVLALQDEQLQACYHVLYRLLEKGSLKEPSEFSRAVSIFLPNKWSTSVDFYRGAFSVNKAQSSSRLDEAKVFLEGISVWLKNTGTSPFKAFLIQEGLFLKNKLIESYPAVELEHEIRACMEVFYLSTLEEGSVRNTRFSVTIGDLSLLDQEVIAKKGGGIKRDDVIFLKQYIELRILDEDTVIGQYLQRIGAIWNEDLSLRENYNGIKKSIYDFFLILYKGNVPEEVNSYLFCSDMSSINKSALKGLYEQYAVEIKNLSGQGAIELRDFHKDLEESHEEIERKVHLTLMKLEIMQEVPIFKRYKERLEGQEIVLEHEAEVNNLIEIASEFAVERSSRQELECLEALSPYLKSRQLSAFLRSVYSKIQKRLPCDEVLETVFAKRDMSAINWLVQKSLVEDMQTLVKNRVQCLYSDRDVNKMLMIFSLQELIDILKREVIGIGLHGLDIGI